jgi:hypothetical protein
VIKNNNIWGSPVRDLEPSVSACVWPGVYKPYLRCIWLIIFALFVSHY